MDIITFTDLGQYVTELNNSLRGGMGIAFHNNGGLITRSQKGISLADWDFIASFNQWGECPSCNKKGVYATFAGIDGPFMEDLFFAEANDTPFLGYRGRISLPKDCVGGLRKISIKQEIVNQWNTEYGPRIGTLTPAAEHIHEGQAQAFIFTALRRLAIR